MSISDRYWRTLPCGCQWTPDGEWIRSPSCPDVIEDEWTEKLTLWDRIVEFIRR